MQRNRTRRKPELRLRRAAFDAYVRRSFGPDVTHAQAAEWLGIHPTTLSQLRTGKRQPTVAAMAAMAHAFGVGLDDLFEVTA